MLIILSVILIILIFLICGDKGSKSIISVTMNALILLIALFLIYRGLNSIIVTGAACMIITSITLFYQNEIDIKTKVAFISVIVVILCLIPLIYFIANGSNTAGFNSEQYEITDSNGYTRNINISMLELQISVMIIALIGTVIDIAVAIESSMYEIKMNNQDLSKSELLISAFTVSKAVLNTSMHTIFYIYIAEYMTLMIQFLDGYSFAELINSKAFCQEFILISVSGIGCCLVVPIATLLGALIMKNDSKIKST